jgi:hypothetical protein
MSSIINRKIFFDGNKFYEVKENKLEEMDINGIDLSKYNLLLDDDCFFYEFPDISYSNRKKMHNIIKHYLMVHYPEEYLHNLKYLELNDKLVVLLFSKKCSNDKVYKILEKAKYFSTPFLETLSRHDKFSYQLKDIYIVSDGNEIFYSNESTGDLPNISSTEVLFKPDTVRAKVNVFESKSFFDYLSKYYVFLIIIFISYIFFIGGEIFKLKSVNKEFEFYKNYLNSLDLSVGIKNQKDPYGILLYKVKSQSSKKIKMSDIIYKITEAVDNDVHIDALNYQTGLIYLKGTAEDFTKLENFKMSLEKLFNVKVYVTDTQKKNNKVIYSIRMEL